MFSADAKLPAIEVDLPPPELKEFALTAARLERPHNRTVYVRIAGR